jgi:hypothetical protein
MNCREILKNIKNNIEESKGEILSEEFGPEFTEDEREYYKNEENFEISDDWFEFFNSADGIELRWKFDTESSELAGYFQFTDFISFHEDNNENKLWCDWYEKEDIEEMKKHKIVERLHGNDAYITVKFEDENYNLYFVDGDSINFGGSKELPKLPLKIAEYVKIVTDYYGVYSLRYHLHKEDFYQNPEKYVTEYGMLEKHIKNFKLQNGS